MAVAEPLNSENGSQLRSIEKLEISKPIDPTERTSQYVEEQLCMNQNVNANAPLFYPTLQNSNVQTTNVNVDNRHVPQSVNVQTSNVKQHSIQNSQIQDLTKFLLKKDMLISRLSCFNDRPETYAFWKGQFKGIMNELSATAIEELDLLSKWLGPQSLKYALSIRSANTQDPIRALERIWERFDEGSPELIQSVLKAKLLNFPRITNKDNVRLYELLDIRSEIQFLIMDHRYIYLLLVRKHMYLFT